MQIIKDENNNVALIKSNDKVITDLQSALHLMITVNYDTGYNNIIIHKDLVTEEFFDLSTRLAGEILQKFINYNIKIAFVGDFSVYPSKSLRDFIYECNKGKDFFFVVTEDEAVCKLCQMDI